MIKQVAWQSMINLSGIKYEEIVALLKFNPTSHSCAMQLKRLFYFILVHCSSSSIRFVCCSAKKGLLPISTILEMQNHTLSCDDELFNLMHKFLILVFFGLSCVYSLNNYVLLESS
jgi:hypothetical protein